MASFYVGNVAQCSYIVLTYYTPNYLNVDVQLKPLPEEACVGCSCWNYFEVSANNSVEPLRSAEQSRGLRVVLARPPGHIGPGY
jgi:hypothetical protein